MSTNSDISHSADKSCAAKSARFLRRLLADDRGAIAMEYILLLVVFVLPVGLLLPRLLSMINFYGFRLTSLYPLPFP